MHFLKLLDSKNEREHKTVAFLKILDSKTIETSVFYDDFASLPIRTYVFYDTFASPTRLRP